jgi:hypothetical protein
VADPAAAVRLPTLADLDAIREAIKEAGARLVIVDPLYAYLPGKADAYKDQDVRSVLAPLAKMADETGVAVVVVRHLNKKPGGDPLYRGGGSIGIIASVRSALLVAPDPDREDVCILASVKCNLTARPPSMSYMLCATSDGRTATVMWLRESSPHTAWSLTAAETEYQDQRSARHNAQEFLSRFLAEGPRPAKEAFAAAADAGISERTLKRAKAGLKVQSVKGDGGWSWRLPSTESAGTHGALDTLGTVGPVGTLSGAKGCQQGQEFQQLQVGQEVQQSRGSWRPFRIDAVSLIRGHNAEVRRQLGRVGH